MIATGNATATAALVTMGAGKAVHIAHVYPGGNLATLCDKWGGSGARRTYVRRSPALEATCKSCQRIANAGATA